MYVAHYVIASLTVNAQQGFLSPVSRLIAQHIKTYLIISDSTIVLTNKQNHKLSRLVLLVSLLLFFTDTRLSSLLSFSNSPRSSSLYSSSFDPNVSSCSSRVSVTRLDRAGAGCSSDAFDFSRESVRAMLLEMEFWLGITGCACTLPLNDACILTLLACA